MKTRKITFGKISFKILLFFFALILLIYGCAEGQEWYRLVSGSVGAFGLGYLCFTKDF